MSDQQQQIYVECYAGYRAEEAPRRFFIDERVIDIIEVLERGLTPKYREFKVRGVMRQSICCVRISSERTGH